MASLTNMAFKATQGITPYMYLAAQKDGLLLYRATDFFEPEAKFAIENAAQGNLVHIRSCSNNKYWVRSSSIVAPDKNRIVAQAVEAVDDRTSPGCTLFSIRIDNNKRATFYHVETGRVVGHLKSSRVLSVDPATTTQAVCDVFDYDGLVVLPKYVAFKGSNGLYYENYANDGHSSFVQKEIGSTKIVCKTHYTAGGYLRISDAFEKPMFWSAGWNPTGPALVAYDNNFPDSVQSMFSVIKIAKNVIALRSRHNNLICVRADYPASASPKDRLVAKSTGIDKDAHLEIIEPVYNRTVNVYEFDLDRARIYNTELLYSRGDAWDNYTDVAQSGTADGRITTTKSHTYTNTVTVSATVTTTFETGIPFIAKSKIEVSATASYSHQWAETTTETQEVGHIFTVVVPPRKTAVARGTAIKSKCDVPFAYIQKDYPTDGGPVRVTQLYDGVFTGANAYDFRSEIRYEELPTYNGPHAPTECIKRIEPHKE
ncbi:uncharacterized protein LOC141602416 [Silene latifolia]|uniref:uncharacterized protein LOC141602416 n=1 Tax=Silene latifolia TaxID=37657 RepID=UPI003D77DABE